jgi:hypothetical protein
MRKIFFRNILLKNKTTLIVTFCLILLFTTFANLLRNHYAPQQLINIDIDTKPQEPQPNIQLVHHTLAASSKSPVLLTTKSDPRNYLQKNPHLLSCAKEYAKWSYDETKTKEATPFDYAKESPLTIHTLRITRAILVFFPIESLEHFKLEFKWLYRSWIEMQKHEPEQWRTDLIVFIENDKKIFADSNLFFNKMNCEFTNLRLSDTDKPMCTLIDFKPLQKRDNIAASTTKPYDAILDETKVFDDDG